MPARGSRRAAISAALSSIRTREKNGLRLAPTIPLAPRSFIDRTTSERSASGRTWIITGR